MQTKLRPGDTFPYELNGVTYRIAVLSAGDRIDLDDELDRLKTEAKSTTDLIRAWVSLCERHVRGWSLDDPVSRLRYHVTEDELNQLITAIIVGNQPTEDDLKN